MSIEEISIMNNAAAEFSYGEVNIFCGVMERQHQCTYVANKVRILYGSCLRHLDLLVHAIPGFHRWLQYEACLRHFNEINVWKFYSIKIDPGGVICP